MTDTNQQQQGGTGTTTTPPQNPVTTPPNSGNNGNPDAKFTQADIDRIAGETRKQAKQTAITELLAELGIENTDSLKIAIKAKKDADEAQKTELQKAHEKATAAEQQAAQLKQQLEQLQAAQKIERRDNAILRKAGDAHKADDVLDWAKRPANKALLDKVMGEDGTLDDKAIDALIEAAKKDSPHLFKSSSTGSSGGNKQPRPNLPGSPANGGGTTPQSSNDEVRRLVASKTKF